MPGRPWPKGPPLPAPDHPGAGSTVPEPRARRDHRLVVRPARSHPPGRAQPDRPGGWLCGELVAGPGLRVAVHGGLDAFGEPVDQARALLDDLHAGRVLAPRREIGNRVPGGVDPEAGHHAQSDGFQARGRCHRLSLGTVLLGLRVTALLRVLPTCRVLGCVVETEAKARGPSRSLGDAAPPSGWGVVRGRS